MKKGKIFILSGPSGSGKTTIHEKILTSPKLRNRIARSISMTTRAPRPGEKNGRDYFFVSPKMFDYKIRAGHLLEWAKVFTQFYGTPAKYVKDVLKTGKSVLLCIDVQGARQVMRACPDAVAIFIKAPSVADLKKRLCGRGTEGKKELGIRLKTAGKELKQEKFYQYTVVNKVLGRACRQVEMIILDNTQQHLR